MNKRNSIVTIRNQKQKTPVVCLTAYTAPFAKILDNHADILLVGDSLGMVLYGMDSTLGVSVDMMIAHGRAVVNASRKACVVVDMPFASYQASPQEAFHNAARIMAETGCQAVKLEGGAEMAETIEFLTRRAIPVMGHIGLMPQHVNSMGGYVYQGRNPTEGRKLQEDARAVADAGAFSIVLEGVAMDVAHKITHSITIPTIGIGASPDCDGQVLVTEDMAGLQNEFTPKFVKRFGDMAGELNDAAEAFAEEVRAGTFPTAEQCYK